MNPFNSEAGATPAPREPAVLRVVERAAAVIWRAMPYFSWRFGPRGRAFGLSDAGFLATLSDLAPAMRDAQVRWLAELLSVRGMPSLALDLQLDVLARAGRRAQWSGADAMHAAALGLRRERERVMPEARLRACEASFLARVDAPRSRRGAGLLIAAEVADQRLGYVDGSPTLDWLVSKAESDPWRTACLEARAMAEGAP